MPTWAAVGVTVQKTPVRITKTKIVMFFCPNILYHREYLIKEVEKKNLNALLRWLCYQGEFTFNSWWLLKSCWPRVVSTPQKSDSFIHSLLIRIHCTQVIKALWEIAHCHPGKFSNSSQCQFILTGTPASVGAPELPVGLHWRDQIRWWEMLILGLWKSLCGVSEFTLFCLSPSELCHMSCQLHWSLTN